LMDTRGVRVGARPVLDTPSPCPLPRLRGRGMRESCRLAGGRDEGELPACGGEGAIIVAASMGIASLPRLRGRGMKESCPLAGERGACTRLRARRAGHAPLAGGEGSRGTFQLTGTPCFARFRTLSRYLPHCRCLLAPPGGRRRLQNSIEDPSR
jgi:hypothetical protein